MQLWCKKMTSLGQETAENCISDADRFQELLKQFNMNQLRFIVARQECTSDKEAAEMLGLSLSAVYHWPETVNEAIKLMAADGVMTALEMRRRALPKAMAVKVAGLDSESEKIRQDVATEIIEGELGKAQAKVDITGAVSVIGIGVDTNEL